MLEIIDLKRTFGQKVAIDSVEFNIERNSIVALSSTKHGAGKTTLINLISGHLVPDHGKILFNSLDMVPLNPCQRKKQGLSCVAQEDYLFDNLTIADHVLAAARNSTSTVNELYAQWRMDSQFLKKSFTALASAGIDVPMETKISDLSLIKKKMLSLGLAMLEPFDLLVWEEPLKGLEQSSYKEFEQLMQELKRRNKTVFFTCSETAFSEKVSDKILIIDSGKIIQDL